MRNLFKFIHRYQFFFLFLLLQAGAIVLTMLHQQYQQSFYLHSANVVSAHVYRIKDNITSYIALRGVNQQLMEEHAMLLEQQIDSIVFGDNHLTLDDDSAWLHRFSYMPARIINNTVIRRNNYITLNRGARHGVEPDMGLMTPHGVVGIITNVSENFSVAMSLLHSNMLVSVKIKKNNQLGSLSWEGSEYRQAVMTYIPPHLELQRGDTIVTSGFSTVFPANIHIGTVSDWEVRRGDTFITADIALALDFNKLSHAYIITNLMKEEQDELEESVELE